MKNLTIKKVALGVLLASYAASGAFAALTATTTNVIMGNKPVVNAAAANSTSANSVDAVIYRGNSTAAADKLSASDSWKVGDTVVLSWKVNDFDGDKESTAYETGITIKFSYYNPTTDKWVDDTVTYTASDVTTASGMNSVSWSIPDAAAAVAATGLAYDIRPTTQYGYPRTNNWANGLITSPNVPGDGGDGTTPTDPGTPNPTNPKDPTLPGTGGETGGGKGPVLPGDSSVRVDIVLVSGNGTTGDIYGTSANSGVTVTSTNPKVGDVFEYKAYNTLNANDDISSAYKGTWSYNGTNDDAKGTTGTAQAAVTTATSGGTVGAKYTIGINDSDALTAAAAADTTTRRIYYAGGQGFRLKVDLS